MIFYNRCQSGTSGFKITAVTIMLAAVFSIIVGTHSQVVAQSENDVVDSQVIENTRTETGNGFIAEDVSKTREDAIFYNLQNPVVRPKVYREDGKIKGVAAVKVEIDGQNGIMGTGDFTVATGTNYNVPDAGYVWVMLTPMAAIPPNARVTNVKYSLKIDDRGDPNNFWCVDYRIYLSSDAHSAPNPWHGVYKNLGGKTDGNADDDSADDSDIYLSQRQTSQFNGEDPLQSWCVWVEDSYSGSVGFEGLGFLDYMYFYIYWEADEGPSSITMTAPNGGEVWHVGNTYSVTWNADPAGYGDVIIAISTNGGSSWWKFPDGVGAGTPNDGEYSYTPVPQNVSDQCMFRVISLGDQSVYDQSDAVFTITDGSPPTEVNVTMRANMSTLPDTLKDHHFVQMRGSLNKEEGYVLPDGKYLAWDSNSELILSPVGGDYWEISFKMKPDDVLEYKFWAGYSQTSPAYINGWEFDVNSIDGLPDINRSLICGQNDTTLELQFYNGTGQVQNQYWRPFAHKPDSVAVYFRVNMGGVTEAGLYNPDVHGPIGVRGDASVSQGILDWGITKVTLQRELNSVHNGSFWSGVAYFPRNPAMVAGQEYKFYIKNEPVDGWEDHISNRLLQFTESLVLAGKDTTVHWRYFNEMPPTGNPQVPILKVTPTFINFGATDTQVTFQINNGGVGTLNWSIVENPDKPWLTSIDPISGTNDAVVTITVDRNQLATNLDSTFLKITSNGGAQDIFVAILKQMADKKRYVAVHVPSGTALPTLDGTLDDPAWTHANPSEMLAVGGVPDVWSAPWTNFADNRAQWKAVWSSASNRLYLAVEVQDDVAGASDHSVVHAWLDDALQLFIDGDRSGGVYYPGYVTAQDWLIRRDNAVHLSGESGAYSGSDFTSAVSHSTNGNWVLECSMLIYNQYNASVKTLNTGDVIGYELWYNDSDNSQQQDGLWVRDHQVGWGYAGPAWQNADFFQELEFGPTPSTELPPNWKFKDQTGNNATVILPTAANPNIEGVALNNGDYVGVFTPAGLCCGVEQWHVENMAITVWGDDDQTTEVDGMQTGEELQYRVYRISQQKEWPTVDVAYSQGTGMYSANAMMILSQFTVRQPATPLLSVTPMELDFGPSESSLTLQIGNTGGGTLDWSISENPDKPWITSISPASGTDAATVTVTVDRAQLAGNSDSGTLLVTSNGGDQNVTVKIAKTTGALPEYWSYVGNTGNNATIVLPTSANPNINGVPLRSGDYIGGFTLSGLCCGYEVWQEQNMSITLWGDDDQTSEIDGYQPTETIYYRVYRLSEGKEWGSIAVEYSQGSGNYSQNAIMILSRFDVLTTSVDPDALKTAAPQAFRLVQNYPNPFNPETTIEFHLPGKSQVELTIFDLNGTEVRTLIRESRASGYHRIQWDGRDRAGRRLASGMYVYQLIAQAENGSGTAFKETRKMILMK